MADADWDDSLLVNSWNDALEEYNKYHSMAARGEKVQDVLKEHSNQEVQGKTNQDDREEGEYDEADGKIHLDGVGVVNREDVELIDGDTMEVIPPGEEDDVQIPPEQEASAPKPAPSAAANGCSQVPKKSNDFSAGPVPPHHLVGTVQDEGLKNLLMSWYYAGYYTGLHEGK